MALFSLTLRSSPLSIPVCHNQLHRSLHSTKPLSLVRFPPRASLSSNDHGEPSDEEDSIRSKELPEDDSPNSQTNPANLNEASVNFSRFASDDSSEPSRTNRELNSSSSSSSTSPVNNVAALRLENGQDQQEQLRETLAVLSQSLALLSSTLTEVSSAVKVLSAILASDRPQSSSSSSTAHLSPRDKGNLREVELSEGNSLSVEPPEPWHNVAVLGTASAATQGTGGAAPADGDTSRSEEDTVPPYLVEQNLRAHKLAYRLQQNFIQARIEGLGKPFQVAVEEFVEACMEAYTMGIGLKELQLQLVLQDGSLSGAFAIRNQRWSDDPVLNEESRIRSLWVRLVYATLGQVEPTENEEAVVDPIDSFVKQVLQMANDNGYDLERIKLEQTFAGPGVTSGAVKAMRENQYLILLTLAKAKSQNK